MAVNPLALGVGQGVGQGIGSVIGDLVGGRNDRRHAKEVAVTTLGGDEYQRRWQAQQQARQRAFESLMQQMMLGFQGNEGASDRANTRYMTDAQLRAKYGDVALGGNIGDPVFGTDAYWERMGRQAPYDPYAPENIVPEGVNPYDEFGVEFDTVSGENAKDIAHGDGRLPGATRDNRGQRRADERGAGMRERRARMQGRNDAIPTQGRAAARERMNRDDYWEDDVEMSAPGGGYTGGAGGTMTDDMGYTGGGPDPRDWWMEANSMPRNRR